MLTVICSERMDLSDKIARIQQMGIRLTEEMKTRMNNMCNLSQGILEHGIQQGLEQGIQKGIEQGREQGRNMTLDILDRRAEFPSESLEETSKAVGCAPENVDAVINRMKRSWRS